MVINLEEYIQNLKKYKELQNIQAEIEKINNQIQINNNQLKSIQTKIDEYEKIFKDMTSIRNFFKRDKQKINVVKEQIKNYHEEIDIVKSNNEKLQNEIHGLSRKSEILQNEIGNFNGEMDFNIYSDEELFKILNNKDAFTPSLFDYLKSSDKLYLIKNMDSNVFNELIVNNSEMDFIQIIQLIVSREEYDKISLITSKTNLNHNPNKSISDLNDKELIAFLIMAIGYRSMGTPAFHSVLNSMISNLNDSLNNVLLDVLNKKNDGIPVIQDILADEKLKKFLFDNTSPFRQYRVNEVNLARGHFNLLGAFQNEEKYKDMLEVLLHDEDFINRFLNEENLDGLDLCCKNSNVLFECMPKDKRYLSLMYSNNKRKIVRYQYAELTDEEKSALIWLADSEKFISNGKNYFGSYLFCLKSVEKNPHLVFEIKDCVEKYQYFKDDLGKFVIFVEKYPNLFGDIYSYAKINDLNSNSEMLEKLLFMIKSSKKYNITNLDDLSTIQLSELINGEFVEESIVKSKNMVSRVVSNSDEIVLDSNREVIVISNTNDVIKRDNISLDNGHGFALRDIYRDNEILNPIDGALFGAKKGDVVIIIEGLSVMTYFPPELSEEQKKTFIEIFSKANSNANYGGLQFSLVDGEIKDKDGNFNYIEIADFEQVPYDVFISELNKLKIQSVGSQTMGLGENHVIDSDNLFEEQEQKGMSM